MKSENKPSDRRIRIVLADDHLVVRQGLAAILAIETDFQLVGEASDGWQACDLVKTLEPDVLILDLRMPVMNGFDVVKKLNERSSNQNILIMTTYDTDEDIWRCLRAGAKGYILKDATHPEIVEAVRTVAARELFANSKIAGSITRRASAPELTGRETEVLTHVVQGLTNKEIAMKLGVGDGTVKTHLKHLLNKLGATTRTQAVHKARERGLIN